MCAQGAKSSATTADCPQAMSCNTCQVHRLPHFVKSERLVLRLWAAEDAEALNSAQAASRYHLQDWLPWAAAPPLSLPDRKVQILDWVKRWEEGGDAMMGVFLGETVVGAIGLHRRIGPSGVELGYWTHVDHVRKGYAAEAVDALTTVALNLPDIDHVEIRHDRANKASSGIPRKLGYQMVAKAARRADEGVAYTWRVTKDQWIARG